jgi:hypothetical protein
MRIFDAEKDWEEEVGEGNVFMWVLKPLYLLAYIPKRNVMWPKAGLHFVGQVTC